MPLLVTANTVSSSPESLFLLIPLYGSIAVIMSEETVVTQLHNILITSAVIVDALIPTLG